jgi:hypothetical protein
VAAMRQPNRKVRDGVPGEAAGGADMGFSSHSGAGYATSKRAGARHAKQAFAWRRRLALRNRKTERP